MGFAQFTLNISADPKGVGSGVNIAINNFKRLGAVARQIQQRSLADERERRKEAFNRLNPEAQLNKLLTTREQIERRLANLDSAKYRQIYAQKQLEIERQILDTRQKIEHASRPSVDIHGILNQIPGYGRIANIFGALKGYGGVAASGLAAYAVGRTVNQQSKSANEIKDLQATTGFSSAGVQKLRFGATATGVSEDTLFSSASNLREQMSKALSGNEKAIANFDRLGYSVERLRKLQPEELFFELAQRVADGEDNIQNYSSLVAILGEDTIPSLKSNLAELTNQFEKSGGVIGDSTVNALADFRAGVQETEAKLKGMMNYIGAGVASGFIRLGTRVKATLGLISGDISFDEFGKENAEADLIGDKDYDESLAKTRELTQKLKDRKAARDNADAQAEFEDFEAQFKAASPESKKKPKSDLSPAKSALSSIDVDKLARIGLFLGGTSPQFQVLKDQLRELQDTRRAIQSVDRKIE